MTYSNADTGNKTADPYVAKNTDHAALSEKVEDLVNFVENQKFCMMTTRIASTGMLASRCMALAAKVTIFFLFSSIFYLLSFPFLFSGLRSLIITFTGR